MKINSLCTNLNLHPFVKQIPKNINLLKKTCIFIYIFYKKVMALIWAFF